MFLFMTNLKLNNKKIPKTYLTNAANKVKIKFSFYMPQTCKGAVVLQLRSFLTSSLGGGNGQLDKHGLPIHEERDHSTD